MYRKNQKSFDAIPTDKVAQYEDAKSGVRDEKERRGHEAVSQQPKSRTKMSLKESGKRSPKKLQKAQERSRAQAKRH